MINFNFLIINKINIYNNKRFISFLLFYILIFNLILTY